MNEAIETIQGNINGLNYYISAYYEFDVPDFDCGSETENAQEMARFDSGELLNLFIEVKVFDKSGNIEGSDSLGQCFVTSADCLNDIQDIVKEYGMIENALNDLKENFAKISL